jgi:hypothetical protein
MVFFCEHCRKETKFMPINFAAKEIGVSRATIYIWMQRLRVHWLELPSGRPMICQQSLLHRTHKAVNLIQSPQEIRLKFR